MQSVGADKPMEWEVSVPVQGTSASSSQMVSFAVPSTPSSAPVVGPVPGAMLMLGVKAVGRGKVVLPKSR